MPNDNDSLHITASSICDEAAITAIHRLAFGEHEGDEIVALVHDLLLDHTALPLLSLLAVQNERKVGHVLFTKVSITQSSKTVSAQILAPLAVVPEFQCQGIGGQLIKEGLKQLHNSGVDLLFVLGHPEYYPRFGFKPAGRLGFDAPYAIAKENSAAWMVQELRGGIIGNVTGKVQCAKALSQPKYWHE